MKTLQELKQRHPNATSEPKPDCEKCDGDGEIAFNYVFVQGHILCPCIERDRVSVFDKSDPKPA